MQTEMFEKKERKKRTPPENMCNEFLWYFKMRWEEKYRGRDFPVTGKQYGQAKNLLSPVPGFPQITKEETFRRVDRFLANQYFNVCSHAFHKLVEHWDMFTATIVAENKPKRESVQDTFITHICESPSCKHEMRQLRSVWTRFKNQTAHCSKCKRTFNVNDVLNKITTLQDHLPKP